MAVNSEFRQENSALLKRIAQGRKMIACSYDHVVGLRADGTVVACGNNDEGQCDVSEWRNIVQVAATLGTTYGLQADGTVVSTSDLECEDWVDFESIGVFSATVTGKKRDGSVEIDAVREEDLSEFRNLEIFTSSSESYIGVFPNGRVITAGDNENGQLDIEHWRGIVDVTTLTNATVGLEAGGDVVCAGCEVDDGDQELLDQASRWTDILAIFGESPILGLRPDGTLAAAVYEEDGEDVRDEIESWQDVIAADADIYLTVALHSDGTVSVCYTDDEYPEVKEAESWRLFYDIDELEEDSVVMKREVRHSRDTDKARIRHEIQTLQTERRGLGLFAGRRKKEIDERLALLNEKLRRMG